MNDQTKDQGSNLPHVPTNFVSAAKCGAKTRRGGSCVQPGMKNGRCRLHGGKSTGPKTEEGKARSRRGNWKHGRYSEAARLQKLAAAEPQPLDLIQKGTESKP